MQWKITNIHFGVKHNLDLQDQFSNRFSVTFHLTDYFFWPITTLVAFTTNTS